MATTQEILRSAATMVDTSWSAEHDALDADGNPVPLYIAGVGETARAGLNVANAEPPAANSDTTQAGDTVTRDTTPDAGLIEPVTKLMKAAGISEIRETLPAVWRADYAKLLTAVDKIYRAMRRARAT
jgi:hypothetical protein